MAADLESGLLQSIDEAGSIQDTGAYAESHSVDHMALVGVMKSLLAAEIILVEVRTEVSWSGSLVGFR